ncbi:MAG: hypothetical protein DRJ29_07645 [Bacteroidetes bacterium]|nr:MAG: hypothetical protein DRJ29_07645 [Bacteroidota bacterium]
MLYSTIASALIAQESDQYYLDKQPLKFRDGVYANIGMVEKNSPIPSTWIETDMDVNDRDFYKNITKADEIVFYDDNGVRTLLNTKSIWGYSYDGDLHINVGGAFHKIDFVGRISHFFALKTTYYPNPFLEYNLFGDFWSTQPVLVTAKHEEYLVDIFDNKVWKFDLDGLERVLKKDPQLWKEFMTLKKREKEYLKYIFLKRYNEKYPLDIPPN